MSEYNQIVKIESFRGGKVSIFIGTKNGKKYLGIGLGKRIVWSLITPKLYEALWVFNCETTALGQNIESSYE